MVFKLKVFSSLCETQEFRINGVNADWKDFGEKEDIALEEAEPYCCGYMAFIPKLPTQAILNKYSINVDEYSMICDALHKKLTFGRCGWCS